MANKKVVLKAVGFVVVFLFEYTIIRILLI